MRKVATVMSDNSIEVSPKFCTSIVANSKCYEQAEERPHISDQVWLSGHKSVVVEARKAIECASVVLFWAINIPKHILKAIDQFFRVHLRDEVQCAVCIVSGMISN